MEKYQVDYYTSTMLLKTIDDLACSQITRYDIKPKIFCDYMENLSADSEKLLDFKTIESVQKIVKLTGIETKPITITLNQNYPNPFNNSTTISYILPSNGKTVCEVFNILGQKVMTIDNGVLPAGYHSMSLNAAELASGIYIYKVISGQYSQSKKFTLMK